MLDLADGEELMQIFFDGIAVLFFSDYADFVSDLSEQIGGYVKDLVVFLISADHKQSFLLIIYFVNSAIGFEI